MSSADLPWRQFRDLLRGPFLVEHDDIDREIYEYLRDDLRQIQILERETSTFPQVREFLFECFSLFFKEEPAIADEREWPKDDAAQFRGKLLQHIIETPTFFRHTARTTLDEFVSIVMAERITRALLKTFQEHEGRGGIGGVLPPAFWPALQQAIAAAMAGAQDDVDALKNFVHGWGTEPGQLERLPVEEKFRLMERLLQSKRLKELSVLAGNAVAILRQKRASHVTHDASEIVGVKFGGDLEHVLPSELALLSRPRLRLLLRLRLVERTYATVEFRPRTELGRGPLVVCIDTSGSMQDGFRENWAKAVAIALYTQARYERRTFAYMHFSSDSELRKVIVRKHEPGIDQLIDIATYAFGGGTDFDRPLREALDLIREEQVLRRADIVFISDGECEVSAHVVSELEQAKRELGLSVFGVHVVQEGEEDDADQLLSDPAKAASLRQFRQMLYGHGDTRGWSRQTMESFCDRVFPVKELTAEAMDPIFDLFLDPSGH